MIKQYTTWTKRYDSVRNFSHPDNAIKALWEGVISFTPAFNGNGVDQRNLAILEYSDSFEHVDRFANNFSDYSMVLVTPLEACALMNKWFPNETPYFTLEEDGFTIKDDRPVDDNI